MFPKISQKTHLAADALLLGRPRSEGAGEEIRKNAGADSSSSPTRSGFCHYPEERNAGEDPRELPGYSFASVWWQIFDFHLTLDEVAKLLKAEQHPRLFTQDFMIGHPEDAFKNER